MESKALQKEKKNSIKTIQLDYIFKVVLVGDSGVGKSNIMTKFCRNQFNLESKPTIGVEFSSRLIEVDNKTIEIQIWDTYGQEKFKSIMKSYYKDALAALLIFDISSKPTFESLDNWYSEIKENSAETIIIVLVGNKSDLENLRQIKREEVKFISDKYNLRYFETSALKDKNIEELFKYTVKEEYTIDAFHQGMRLSSYSNNDQKSKRCCQ